MTGRSQNRRPGVWNDLSRRRVLAAAGGTRPAREDRLWAEILARARGRNVFCNAWGRGERTNTLIAWTGQEASRLLGVTVDPARVRDTAEAVTRRVAERQAGRDEGGSVGLIWINGPNLLAIRSQNLLFGSLVEALLNWLQSAVRFLRYAGPNPCRPL